MDQEDVPLAPVASDRTSGSMSGPYYMFCYPTEL